MMSSPESEIVGTLRTHVGDKLRVVAEYGPDEYHILYQRDDVEDGYTDEELEQAFQDLILEGMARGHLEGVFRLGAFKCGVITFEEGIVFHFATGEYSGVAVSVDDDAEFEFNSFVADCTSWIDTDSTG